MILLSIDPGTKTTGWAIFTVDEHNGWLIRTGHFTTNDECWIARLDHIVSAFNCQLFMQIETVLIEQPEVFSSSIKGSAASNSGAVCKLTALAFSLRQSFKLRGREVMMVPVTKWKGQLPKLLTQKRMKKRWGHVSDCNDETDAVGIGDWYIRKQLELIPIID